MDKYGRKNIVITSIYLFFIGGVLIVASVNSTMLFFGRIFIGFGTGITSLNVPIYISEICPTEMKSRVIAIYSFLFVFGAFLANVVILCMHVNSGNNKDWRFL